MGNTLIELFCGTLAGGPPSGNHRSFHDSAAIRAHARRQDLLQSGIGSRSVPFHRPFHDVADLPKADLPMANAATATSFAAFKTAGMVPPISRPAREIQRREPFQIRFFEGQRAELREIACTRRF